MKPNFLMSIVCILACTTLSVNAQTITEEGTRGDNGNIEVIYFHNTRRCATCMAVESVTKSTLEEKYPDQMKSGKITFQSLNIEEEANEPLAQKLHVSGQTLLFLKDGEKKDLTNDAFMYARTKPEKLSDKIVETINKL
jgi:hypothetical protein